MSDSKSQPEFDTIADQSPARPSRGKLRLISVLSDGKAEMTVLFSRPLNDIEIIGLSQVIKTQLGNLL